MHYKQQHKLKKPPIIAVGITVLALLLAGGAGAATLTVDSSGGANYTRIQDAINNASAGDTILVYSGTYYENVDVNKQLILRGIDNGGGKPVVDAGGRGSAIILSAGDSTLEGFTAINAPSGYWCSFPIPDFCGGIRLTSNNNLIKNNSASNNSYGIYLSSSSNNTLYGNDASNNSAGIVLSSSSNNTLNGNSVSKNNDGGIHLYFSSDNTLNGNSASHNFNSGIYIYNSSNARLINNIMAGNRFNFWMEGLSALDFDNQIDASNIVDGKPIYYMKGTANTVYDSSTNAGTFYCISCINVTLKDLDLNRNGRGVFLWNTTHSRIQNISASNNSIGISLSFSSNNMLSDNNASNNYYGHGIDLYSSNRNTLSGNNASNNDDGISFSNSTDNTLFGNIASNNSFHGINLVSSSSNVLLQNLITGSPWNFNLDGISGSDFDNQIDTSNMVDGKPIYYIKSAVDTVYDYSINAGTFYCISCVNVTLKDLNLNRNGMGIFFWNTTRSRIQNVSASDNWAGISLSNSGDNILSGNIALNNAFGISLSVSSNNTIYNNYFNNTNNFRNFFSSVNTWNTTRTLGTNIIGGSYLGGNFWANPGGTGFSQTCADGNSDGICDSPYALDISNIDYLPLTTDIISRYDSNSNGVIERAETVAAVVDFFAGKILRSQAVAVVVAFFSTPSPTEIKYHLLGNFSNFFYCDPDFYPIVVGGAEQANALQQFPDIQNNTEEFQPILRQLNLSGVTNFSADQKLLIYREHKKLNAIFLEPSGGAYTFRLLIRDENGTFFAIEGIINLNKSITVLNTQPAGFPCPICLAGNTSIDTPSGPVAVKDLQKGMQVWTADSSGAQNPAVVLETVSVPVPPGYRIVHLVLDDGRELFASPGHPTADGRTIGNLSSGDILDGARIVVAERIPYYETRTYDILPSGRTGFYRANGILIGSTLATPLQEGNVSASGKVYMALMHTTIGG